MLRSLEHARQLRYKEGLVQRLVVHFLCIFTMVPGESSRVGARQRHSCSRSVKDFFESLRMVSWFSLNTSIKFLLPGFTLNQQGFLSYLHRYYEEDADPLEEPAATIDGAAAKAHYSEELRRFKKGCNRIALAAKLLTPWLRHEMMLYMKVTVAHWLAFGTLASL